MNFLLKRASLPFWLFTFSVIMVLIVSQLIQDGMFMDGMFYTCVGKNLADGLGTFWNPHLSKTFMYSFHVQPPLYFGILALFYKILGSSMYVERIFDFVFFIGAAIYIHKIWKKVFSNNQSIASLSWLPILFWVSIPVCFWAYTNHVEEVVMSFFALAAVYHVLLAVHMKEHVIFNLIVAGLFIFLSSLTKGVQGLFPLASIVLYWFVMKNSSFIKACIQSFILFIVPASIYGFLLLKEEVYVSFQNYFNIRLVRAFNGVESTTNNRFDIMLQLILELLPIIFIVAIVLFFTRKNKNTLALNDSSKTMCTWLILVGLSGSIPLMVTLEQRNFYLVTSLPYFALALAILVGPRLIAPLEKLNENSKKIQLLSVFSLLLLLATFVYTSTKIGDSKRDVSELEDVYKIGKIIPHGEIIGIPIEMNEDWSTRYYLLRYFYIHLDVNAVHHFYILRKDLSTKIVPEGYLRSDMQTKYLDLYIK